MRPKSRHLKVIPNVFPSGSRCLTCGADFFQSSLKTFSFLFCQCHDYRDQNTERRVTGYLDIFNQILAMWLHSLLFCNFDKDRDISRAVTIKREKLKMKQKKSLVPKLDKRPGQFCLLKSKACLLNPASWLLCVVVLCLCSCCSPRIHIFCIDIFPGAWPGWTKTTLFL